MKIEIIKLNHTGAGIGQVDGKIIFVQKTLPGDVIEGTNLKEHKNFIEASCNHIYKESPLRIPIQCPYYKKCGGCQLMDLPYSEQLKYKKEKVENILTKYASIELNNLNLSIKESPNQYHYRNKITLQVQNGIIGLFTYNTNDIVKVDSCFLISKKMNQLIQLMQNELNLENVNQIMIREAKDLLMVQVMGEIEEANLINTLSSQVESLYLNDKHLYGKKYLIDQLGKYQFQISPKSFFQINHLQTINLYNQIKQYLGPNNKNILDLYCGTGTIGIYVSDYCEKVTGIELNPSSVADAILNIKRNKLNHIHIEKGDVGKVLQAKNIYDAIIVDPPRNGLDKKTKQVLKQIKSPKIIYVSCDSITLARDLNELKEFYDIQEITLFDMFPNTYHVECVMWLCLKK